MRGQWGDLMPGVGQEANFSRVHPCCDRRVPLEQAGHQVGRRLPGPRWGLGIHRRHPSLSLRGQLMAAQAPPRGQPAPLSGSCRGHRCSSWTCLGALRARGTQVGCVHKSPYILCQSCSRSPNRFLGVRTFAADVSVSRLAFHVVWDT